MCMERHMYLRLKNLYVTATNENAFRTRMLQLPNWHFPAGPLELSCCHSQTDISLPVPEQNKKPGTFRSMG